MLRISVIPPVSVITLLTSPFLGERCLPKEELFWAPLPGRECLALLLLPWSHGGERDVLCLQQRKK